MRLENNFVQVENNPVVINKVNSVAAAFGWTVQSIQVTDSAVAYSSGSVTWATEFGAFTNNNVSIQRTSYASISYQRDMDDPKYREWVKLENEYNSMLSRSFLTDTEQRQYEQMRKEAEKKIRKSYQAAMMFGQCVFYGMALLSVIMILCVPETTPIMGICAIVFICLGYFVYNRGMKKTLRVDIEKLIDSSLSKRSDYVQLMQTNALRREQSRTQLLNRARDL